MNELIILGLVVDGILLAIYTVKYIYEVFTKRSDYMTTSVITSILAGVGFLLMLALDSGGSSMI